MRRLLLPLLLAAPLLAQERTPATLVPAGRAVVVPGSNLRALRGIKPPRLWLGAWRQGAFIAIPFQVDERVPGGDYAWLEGEERRSDVDEGLDDDDELVFYARDAGDRGDLSRVRLGQVEAVEIELHDPAHGQRAWAYLLAFPEDTPTPPRAGVDRASLEWREGEPAGLRGERLLLMGRPGNLLHLDELRLASGGGWGPDLLDRTKVQLVASYLFTGIERAGDEVRAGLRAWRDGPVRVVGKLFVETYLIWGHWIRTLPAGGRLVMWEDRLELSCPLRTPVDLELDARSELRLSLDLSPAVPGLRVWTDRNPARLRAGAPLPRALDRTAPAWIAVSGPGGAVLLRARGGETIRTGALFLRDDALPDGPEDHPGSHANAGWTFDLTGLRAGVHQLDLSLRATEPGAGEPGNERELLRGDLPLQVVVR